MLRKIVAGCGALFLLAKVSTGSDTAADFANPADKIVLNSRIGPMQHAVRSAPDPVVPPAVIAQHLTGTGVFALDMDAGGIVGDVRIVRSTGHKMLDQAAIAALRKWMFRPHAINKAIVPITFTGAGVLTPASSRTLPRR